MASEFSNANTMVFWDVDDFPVPSGRSINWVCESIQSALKNSGYGGEVSIKAYGVEKPEDNLDILTAFEVKSSKYARQSHMLFDIGYWAMDNPKTNLMVIAKEEPERSELLTFLEYLMGQCYCELNVLYVVPEEIVPEETSVPEVVIWYWESLLEGGKDLDSRLVRLLADRSVRTDPLPICQPVDPSKLCSFCGLNQDRHYN